MKSAEARFWEWFEQNELRLFNFERQQDRNIEDLRRALQRVNRSLTFEIGSEANGRREFIISADGNRDAFPSVITLADTAPHLPRWNIIKFRPRKSDPFFIGLPDSSLSSDDIKFTLEPEGSRIGVTLYLGDALDFDEKAMARIGFILLDHTLGEFDVETSVGSVHFYPKEMPSRLKKLPLQQLAVEFDQLSKLLAN